MKETLQYRELIIESGPLAQEEQWRVTLELLRLGNLRSTGVAIEQIQQELDRSAGYDLVNFIDRSSRQRLQRAVTALRAKGETELLPPWPGPDRSGGGWVWDPYSHERVLARARAVYVGAMQGYQQLVETWFPKFAAHLRTMVTLPTRFVGVITWQESGMGGNAPVLDWHLDPLPLGTIDQIDIQLADVSPEPSDGGQYHGKLLRLRPDAAAWMSAWHTHGRLDIFGVEPATDIAYDWLWKDLHDIQLVDGMLGSRRSRRQ